MELTRETVAVVTGAGSGIGLALADAFARQGCRLVLADVQDDALAAAAGQIAAHGVDVMSIRTDVSKREEVDALAAATMERFGAVHVVCNNAGVSGAGDPWLGPIEGWEWTMGVNFWGVVYGVRAFLPHIAMSGAGHIVNTASIAGLYPGFSPAYDASKHAVVALTEGLFHNVRDAGLPIGVSCLCPGWVRTGIIDADRNWPDELGPAPVTTAGGRVSREHVRRAIDEGMPPAVVADLVVDAIRSGRYWVFPHPDFLEIAVERFHRIADAIDPQPVEQMPGMQPRSQIMAEVMAAMAAQAESAGE
ncbi:MAG TPA: SDR family NAD(P)-dependent oxidoreductase [Ilumatobacter sp.]|nr:SDR family NAD(P)-dependent oxidoreductase [Ilumatobacter sp.]